MRLRALVALGLASFGVAMLALIGVGGAAQAVAPLAYPVGTCSTLSVSTQNPNPGQAITVSGSSFLPDAKVHLILSKANSGGKQAPSGGYDLGTFTTNASGAFSGSITLPDSITNGGHYYIYATSGVGATGNCPADPYQTLNIQAVSTSTSGSGSASPGGTAFTGLDIAGLVAIGVVLVGAGAFFTRRGRTPVRS